MKPSVRASSVDGLRDELKDLRRSVMDLQRRGEPLESASDREVALDDLTDVETTPAPSDGDTLVYDSATELWKPGTPSGGGGVPFLVAAVNATNESKAAAAYQCDGTADDVQVAAAITAAVASGYGSRVLLSEGYFGFSSTVTLTVHLQGAGKGITVVSSSAATAFTMDSYSGLHDLYLEGPNTAGSVGVDIVGDHAVVDACEIYNCATVVQTSALGTDARITNNDLSGGSSTVNAVSVGGDRVYVGRNFIAYPMNVSADEAMVFDNRFDPAQTVTIATGAVRTMFAHNYLSGGLSDFSNSGTTTMRGTNFSNTGTW